MSSMKCTGIKHSLWKSSGSAEAWTETRYEEYRIHKKGKVLVGSTFIYLHWKNSFHLLCIWWGRKAKQKEKEWLKTFSRLYLPPVLESKTITEHWLSFPPTHPCHIIFCLVGLQGIFTKGIHLIHDSKLDDESGKYAFA